MKNVGTGLAVSLLPAALFMVPGALVLGVVGALAVLAVGLARQIQAGLQAVRSGHSPLRPVVATTACFWLGASVGYTLGWSAVLAADFGFPFQSSLAIGVGDLLAFWVVAAVCGGVVAAVTGAWRAASRPA